MQQPEDAARIELIRCRTRRGGIDAWILCGKRHLVYVDTGTVDQSTRFWQRVRDQAKQALEALETLGARDTGSVPINRREEADTTDTTGYGIELDIGGGEIRQYSTPYIIRTSDINDMIEWLISHQLEITREEARKYCRTHKPKMKITNKKSGKVTWQGAWRG